MNAPQVKICGITRPDDAVVALAEGAAHLGFILYQKSPRCVTLEQAHALFAAANVPAEKRVAVGVNPDPDRLVHWKEGGFALFQVHFPHDLPRERIASWAAVVGRENLWLAPKLPMEESFPEDLLDCAEVFLIDAYSPHAYGGTGETADWARFAEWKNLWPGKEWILAGGLSPENVAAAVAATGTNRLDANSGVESSPGTKDSAKVRALFERLGAT